MGKAIKPTTRQEAIDLLRKVGWERCPYSRIRERFIDKQGRTHDIILDEKRPWVISYHSLSIPNNIMVYLVSGEAMYETAGRAHRFDWYLNTNNLEKVIYNGRYLDKIGK